MITLSKPLYFNQQFFGILGADLPLEQIAKTISDMPVGEGAQALMITRDGTIIANRDSQLIMQPTTRISPQFTQTEIEQQLQHQEISEFDINGKSTLVYLKAVPGTDWLVGLQVEQDVVERSYLQTRMELLIVSAVFTLLAAVLIGGAVTYLFRDLNRVSAALSEIARGEGDLTVRIHLQQDEVTMVATAATEMAAATHEIASNVDATSREAHNAVNLSDTGRQ